MSMNTMPMNRMLPGNLPGRRQRGFSMIEVLITFFVLSIGLLGMAALQVKAVQYNQGAMQRSQATSAANDIMDRMRLNRAAVNSNNYNIAMGATPPSGTSLYALDLQAWTQFLGNNLPGGQGSIVCQSNVCTITIQWLDRFNPTAGQYESLSFTTQI